jgi:hypothetical protein
MFLSSSCFSSHERNYCSLDEQSVTGFPSHLMRRTIVLE